MIIADEAIAEEIIADEAIAEEIIALEIKGCVAELRDDRSSRRGFG